MRAGLAERDSQFVTLYSSRAGAGQSISDCQLIMEGSVGDRSDGQSVSDCKLILGGSVGDRSEESQLVTMWRI